MRFASAALLVLVATNLLADDGILPVGADGKPLNLDFETGTLHGWTAEGNAFARQPVEGDTVSPRRKDMKSRHQGKYWVGGWERGTGDAAQGTLTSAAFTVTHPWCSFLVGGGPYPTTAVEIVRTESGAVFSRTSGLAEEDLRRVAVDLRNHRGKEIFIRLVDRQTGHWGHVNFDDFRFHSEEPKLPPRPAPRENLTGPTDQFRHAGLTPEQSAAAMTVPEGFTVTLFAGEPDVRQPVAFCIDDRGRLWVAEAYDYPIRRPEGQGRDRILIFEDADGDGKFDKRTVFMEGLNLVSGLELGFGGVWVGSAPHFLFIPIDASGDKPAGKPQILLDGWGYQDTHETLNTFTWAPDGWLWGCHGVFTHSKVGKPGTPAAERVPINAGIWRYHPTRHVFEVVAHGTSNPWGLAFNDRGEAFIEACVIPHCYHIVPGGRYERQAGSHFNPYTYDDIKTIADHRHYVGANPHGGNNRSDSAGGGHAHCGLMCYQGGAWPEEYRGKLFMGNIHGRRINTDILKPKGSGYVASHGPDFLLANDAWARFINLSYGPDGNVYLIDWYDQQACHDTKIDKWDRSNGRVYKVAYRGTKPVTGIDLAKASDDELVQHQTHANEWYARHARRLLQERAAKVGDGAKDALAKLAADHADTGVRQRALWTLAAVGGLTGERLDRALANDRGHVRSWAVRLALDNGPPTPALLAKLEAMAQSDAAPGVRLAIAGGLQRLTVEQRWPILNNLVKHGEDAADPNLPLMVWFALESQAESDPGRTLHEASHGRRLPPLLEFAVRRVGAIGTPAALDAIVCRLARTDDGATQATILAGLQQSLKGRRQVPMPAQWREAYSSLARSEHAIVRETATALAVTFGDPQALAALRRVVGSDAAPAKRRAALAALVGANDAQLPELLRPLLNDTALRADAIRALAVRRDGKTAAAILDVYPKLTAAEKRDAVATLASDRGYANELLAAVERNVVSAIDVPADLVRQLRALKDPAVDERLAKVWGVVRESPAERKKAISTYRKMLTDANAPKPDLAFGRAVYAKTCQQCHVLFGVGGKVGPEITGANRGDLNYLLENVLDPSAVIPKEYAVTRFELKSGRVVLGIAREETPSAVTVVTATETLTLAKTDIGTREGSDVSMMPDDQLKPMTDAEVRALFAYLQSPAQTPMLATADNAVGFFNGKDLTGWDGDAKLWSVENGEIVGRSPGIKKNEFLKSHLAAGDFKLSLKVKLTPNKENSGIQFRSEALANGDVKGLQADIGAGWWGKLYEEHGRELLWNKPGEQHVKKDEWNEYVIEAVGDRVRTWINGQLCVDREDNAYARRGIFALQIHSGGPMEVRFKELKLELR